MNWENHKQSLLKDVRFQKVLAKNRLEYEIAREVIAQRLKKKLTQKELALKLKTRQSVISRLENARTTPSLSFLRRLAEVFNVQLKVAFH